MPYQLTRGCNCQKPPDYHDWWRTNAHRCGCDSRPVEDRNIGTALVRMCVDDRKRLGERKTIWNQCRKFSGKTSTWKIRPLCRIMYILGCTQRDAEVDHHCPSKSRRTRNKANTHLNQSLCGVTTRKDTLQNVSTGIVSLQG